MLTPGTVLQGRYLIQEAVGEGGMGSVYRAVDRRLRTVVAVKETRFGPLEEPERRAFEREARLLAGLRHPALPRVIDHFDEGDGQFLVMEFVPGEDLATRLDRTKAPCSLEEALAWADRLLDALEYLHGQEPPIFHRDIKPQNLKLTPRGELMLLDFGLAKGKPPQLSAGLTGPETVPYYLPESVPYFTRYYAPLEQIERRGTDARSDLYSVGATLYTLLTAMLPPDALLRKHARQANLPDPLRPASEHNREVPAAVAAALGRALALEPDERPRTAAQLRRELRAAAPAPSSPPPRSTLEELYTQALTHFYLEEWPEAVELLRTIVARAPDYEAAASKLEEAARQQQLAQLYDEGIAAAGARDWRAAARSFEQLLALDPSYRDAASRLEAVRRQQTLAGCYEEARRLHRAQQWRAVLSVFERIAALDPAYPDPDGLLASAREALAAAERQRELAELYDQALRKMDARAWREAAELLERIRQREPGYRGTEGLLQRARQELGQSPETQPGRPPWKKPGPAPAPGPGRRRGPPRWAVAVAALLAVFVAPRFWSLCCAPPPPSPTPGPNEAAKPTTAPLGAPAASLSLPTATPTSRPLGAAPTVTAAAWLVVAETRSPPVAVAVDGQGNLYVAEGNMIQSGDDRVQKLTPDGRRLARWGSSGSGPGQFHWPASVAVDELGNLYVADAGNDRVQKLSPEGRPLAQWGAHGSGPGQFDQPTGVAVDGYGNLYVADLHNDRVQKLAPDGEPRAQWGTHGSGPGQFDGPSGIAVDRAGQVYVADAGNDCIQKLSPAGRPLAQWGTSGSGPGQFKRPDAVAVDGQGNLYVADAGNDRVQKLSPDGQLLAQWGAHGSGPGQFDQPTAMAVDGQGTLYVAEWGNTRVQMLPGPSRP